MYPPPNGAGYLFRGRPKSRACRRLEINAWMISEAGKNYAEADADTAEGIDFLEYYAHEALRYDEGIAGCRRNHRRRYQSYHPTFLWELGCSISPWNFPFAICLGNGRRPHRCREYRGQPKPAPDTPMMGWIITEIFEEARTSGRGVQFRNR